MYLLENFEVVNFVSFDMVSLGREKVELNFL